MRRNRLGPLRGRLSGGSAACSAGYLVVVVAAMFLEESLIYFPVAYPEGDWNPSGLEFEDAWFQAADGTRLHGWYVPKANARAAVLFCHGNGGNITHRVDALEMLHRRTRRVGADLRLPRLRPERGQAERGGGSGRRPRGPRPGWPPAKRSPPPTWC